MTKLNVAICQAAPIPLDFDGGIEKAVRLAREAVEGTVSIRRLGSKHQKVMPLSEAVEALSDEAIAPDVRRRMNED